MRKKIIITLIAILSSFALYGQDYPKYEKDSLGNQYVVITMEQARYVDTKLDILELMEKNDILGQGLDSITIRVVNDLEKVIGEQEIQITNLFELVNNKDEQILNLQSQIANNMLIEETYRSQVGNLNTKVDIYETQVDKLEKKVFWGGISSIIVIIGAFLIGGSL
jgi:chromosome segregation ATPase